MRADVHSGHTHSHAGPEAPATEGIVLRQARIYNLIFSPLLRRSEKTLLNLAGVKPGSKVLDVGCGPASLTLAAKRRSGLSGEVCGVDASPQMIAEARKQAQKARLEIDFRNGVAEKLPWEDHKFDAVVSRLVFHHLPGDLKEQALAEIYRVLKPGGICLVADFELDTFPGPRFLKQHVEGMHHMMRVDVAEYVPLFEASHFEGVEWGPTGHAILAYVKGVKPR
jgi:demethylmenaquinone methyltransferase/2-methoxy-6-polyprenyl-1,4-benzoquinol methylase/phosphoethanolamine N-methyltransferase